MGTRMTRIQRISADQIRVNPPDPSHPRSHITRFCIAYFSSRFCSHTQYMPIHLDNHDQILNSSTIPPGAPPQTTKGGKLINKLEVIWLSSNWIIPGITTSGRAAKTSVVFMHYPGLKVQCTATIGHWITHIEEFLSIWSPHFRRWPFYVISKSG